LVGFARLCLRLLVGLALLGLPALQPVSAGAPQEGEAPAAGTTTRVSVRSNGTQGNDFSAEASLSATGRFVAFSSVATNLVGGDTNGVPDVFVHDRKTDKTTRVSVASDGTQGNDFSDAPSLSATGRYVAFFSLASNLVSGDTNGTGDVFVHDRATGQTTRVSVRSNGTQGNDLSLHPSLSATGRYVAFDSLATNLAEGGDTNSTSDVFVHDRETGQTTLVSVASDGTQGSGYSDIPSISATGRYVAFHSFATNLVSDDTNGVPDVFVHDRKTGQTTRVSVASDGTQGNDNSDGFSLSATGRYVAFHSFATNLAEGGDTNSTSDVFVHDQASGQTTRVSVASNGTQGNGGSYDPSISATGRYLAFYSDASNLVNGDTNSIGDIFVHNRQGVGSVEEPLPAELEAGDY
jgi:Tol biopolymer transport system component